jgi:hypothetical protein
MTSDFNKMAVNTISEVAASIVSLCSLLTLVLILFSVAGTMGQDKKVLFSDDFESYSVGAVPLPPWSRSGDGKVFVDSSRSFSGEKSVHFVSGEAYRNRAILTFASDYVFPLKENRYYGKMEMYVEEASPDGVHWTMVESSGRIPGKEIAAEVRYGGQHNKRLMANYETVGAATDCWQHSSLKIPEGRWFRIDWFFDGQGNIMKLWIDGRPVNEITVKGRGEGCLGNDLNGEWIFPVFENVQIGWVDYQPNGGERNVWIDDFAISEKPMEMSDGAHASREASYEL